MESKTVAEQLEALNSRPAVRDVVDADGQVIETREFPNRSAAKAAPVPEGCSVVISVDVSDLA